jgi:uncharacterized repeat protein (TIGR01451 family)
MTQPSRILWLGVFAATLLLPSRLTAQTTPSWSVTPIEINGQSGLNGVSCPWATFCVAVDAHGNAFTFDGLVWTSASIDSTTGLQSVSCVSPAFCMAGDNLGKVLRFDGTTWSAPQQIDTNATIWSISCASTTFCAAGDDNGNVMIYDGSSWSAPFTLDPIFQGRVTGVSCPSPGFCVAVDQNGKAYKYNGAGWTAPFVVDAKAYFFGVSCASPTFCAAVDYNFGAVYTYTGGWSGPNDIDNHANPSLFAVSCASATFCVAVDPYGNALTYNGSSWSMSLIDRVTNQLGLQAVSCPSSTFCAAVDSNFPGNAVIYSSGFTLGKLVDKPMISPSSPQSLTYSLALISSGPAGATGVTVSDTLPTGTSIVNAMSTQGSCSGTQTIVCSIGSLPAGTKVGITIKVNTNGASGKVTNTATATSNEYPATSSNTVTTIVRSASDLSILKTAAPTALSAPGDTLVYTLSVHNNGPSDALDVQVSDLLPPHVTLQTVSRTQGACYGAPSIYCDLGTMASGSSASITITLVPLVGSDPTGAGVVVNMASVASPFNDDPVPSNNSSSVTVSCPYCTTQAATSLTLTSSLNPSTQGQNVVFTAKLSTTAASTPTGSVVFSDGGVQLATKALDAFGSATYSTSSLTAGTHTITATYPGDQNFKGSSASLTQTVTASTGGGGGGGGCACNKTGNYQVPVTPVDPGDNPLVSPNQKYTVTPTQSGGVLQQIDIYNSAGHVLTVLPVNGTLSWGFSPDDHRLVVHTLTGQIPSQIDNITVYDLSATPPRQIVNTQSPAGAISHTSFSPSGRYLLVNFNYGGQAGATLPTGEVALYLVQGVAAQLPLYDATFLYQQGVGPDVMGVETQGFSPSNPETSFVYAYLDSNSQVQWNLVSLAKFSKTPLATDTLSNHPADFWEYSPCGDLIAVVKQISPLGDPIQVQIDLTSTVTGAPVAGNGTMVTTGSSPLTLLCTSTQQEMQVGNQPPTTLSANTGCTNTPTGSQVPVIPPDQATGLAPVTITFNNVTAPGATTLNVSSSGPQPPQGTQPGTPVKYFYLTTTATFASATVCISYADLTFGSSNIILLHNKSGAWDIPNQTIDTVHQTICATVTSFSPFTIVEQASSPTVSSISVPSDVYGTPASVAVSISSSSATVTGTVALSVDGGAAISMALSNGSATFNVGVLNAGTHMLSANFASQGSFLASTASGTLTVAQAPLTLTANNVSKVYGASLPTLGFSASGFVNGDTTASLTTQPTLSTTATAASAVGSYPVSSSGAVDPNYSIAYVQGTLTVTPALLTFTANNATKILNAPNPVLMWTPSSFVNGDTASVLTSNPTCNTTATANSPVGSYPITCSGANAANYNFSYVSGTLRIQYATNVGHLIQPPINADGTSVFNQGRTVPAKFSVYDANGVSIGTPGVVSSFYLTGIFTGTASTAVEAVVDTNNPDTAFRWDPTGQQWIFNITTGNLAAGSTYIYTIALNDGSSIVFQYGLR